MSLKAINNAKKNVDDEWYTLPENAVKFVDFARTIIKDNLHLKEGSVLYLPCDGEQSEILKEVRRTLSEYKIINTSDDIYFNQDIIKSADFIFTNPPFHGYREIVKLICSYKKPFLFYCAQSSLSYKLMNEYKCVYISPFINGGTPTQWFKKPDGSIRNCGVCYITNVREAYKPVPFYSPKRISRQMKCLTYYEPYVKGYIERCSLINDDGEDYHKVGDIFSIPAIQMIHLDYSKYRILGEASRESHIIHFYYSLIVEKYHD